MKTLLSNKFLYLLGQFMSQIGSNFFLIAMIIWLKMHGYPSLYIGLFLFTSSIASLLCSPFSGVWVDSIGSKNVMVITDFINGLIMILIALLMYKPEPSNNVFYLILCLTFTSSIMNSFFSPASLSIIGNIVAKEDIKILTSWSSNIIESSKIIGRSLGGLLVLAASPALLIFLNGLSFILSAFLETKIKITSSASSMHESKQAYFDKLKDGFLYLKNDLLLFSLFIVASVTNFFIAINAPILPTLIKDFMGYDLSWYGIVMSGYGCGALIGGFLARKVKKDSILLNVSLVLQAIPLFFIPLIRNIYLLFLAIFFIGMMYVFVQVNIISFVTERVSGEYRGRVFSLMFAIVGLFMPLSYLVSGYISNHSQGSIFMLYKIGGIFVPLLWAIFLILKKRIMINEILINI